MSLVAAFKRPGPSGFGYGSTAEEVTAGLDLSGTTILVTGATSGIGRETVRVLALRGARVLATARTKDKAAELRSSVSRHIEPYECELSEPKSVRACVEAVSRDVEGVDAVVCNAGVMAPPKLETKYGYELQFFANHIGHYILTTGLLPHLSETGRIVMVSSDAHRRAPSVGIEFDNLTGEKRYSPLRAYGQSKLANLLHARALARRMPRPRQTSNALHPGVIATNLWRHLPKPIQGAMNLGSGLFKSIPEGAATQTYLASSPAVATTSGEYFSDCNIARASRNGRDLELSERLFETSADIVAKL